MAGFGDGSKPLLTFLFQGTKKKKMRWPSVIGLFEISREKKALTFILFYFVYWSYDIQIDKAAWLASVYIGKPQDLGSSPRSIHISILFFNNNSHAAPASKRTICPQESNIHVHLEIRSKAED